MIQNDLMKAKTSCYELDRCTPKFISEARAKVEQVNILSNKIKEILNHYLDHGISASYHHELIKLNSEIIALTQGL